jgi:hypothetical protein
LLVTDPLAWPTEAAISNSVNPGSMAALIKHDVTKEELDVGETSSVWVKMARSEAAMQRARGAVPQGAPTQDREWRQLSPQQDPRDEQMNLDQSCI